VEGVYQRRAGADRKQRGLSAEEAGLGGVGVHEVRPEAPDDRPDLSQGASVVQWVDRLSQAGQVDRLGALSLRQVGHRLLAGSRPAVYQEGLVTVGVEAGAAQEARLVCRPAEVEAGDHPQDADAAQAGCSPRPGTRAGTAAAVSRSAITATPTAK
jgi:hypothetical protein